VSVAVELERLREEVARFGARPYLITVGADGRPHAVSVTVDWEGEELFAAAGATTVRNAAASPAVTLLWAPIEAGGYSLIADVMARVDGDGGPASIVALRPVKAVLHRTVPGPDARSPCGMDCVPLYSAPASAP